MTADAEYIHGHTFEAVGRAVLDMTSWDSQAGLFLAFGFDSGPALLPSRLLQTVAEAMTPVPEGVQPILAAVAATGKSWGVHAAAPPDLVGMGLLVTGWALPFDPDDVAAQDQAHSYARDRRLKSHPNRVRVSAMHIARNRQPVLSLYQARGSEPHVVDMPGGIVDGLLECAAAFVPNWRTGV